MKRWLFDRVRLWFLVSLSGCLSTVAIGPGWAQIKPMTQKQEVQSQENIKPLLSRNIRQLSEIQRPSTSAQMLVQSPTPSNQENIGGEVVPITGVKANPTDKGVEIILETPLGSQLQVTNRSTGNNFIADVSGGQLRLPDGEAFTFRSLKPVAGIIEITVTNINANTVRVTVVGEKALPTVELFDDNAGLVFGVTSAAIATSPPQQPQTPQPQQKPAIETPPQTPSAQTDEPIELVVTGEQDGYRVPDASVGTRTDTPLRDIPQSIQVVPRQVLKDQQVDTLREALRNVPGVAQGSTSQRVPLDSVVIRGFSSDTTLRNGLLDSNGGVLSYDSAIIDQIQVLRGPASVLYGQGSPGGTISYITKQPLTQPFYEVEASVGSFGFYRGSLDLSGPVNTDKTILYRLNLAAQTSESFLDFFNAQRYVVAPTLTWLISDRTKLTLETEYLKQNTGTFDVGLPAEGTVLPNPNGRIPRNRYLGEPDVDSYDLRVFRVGYNLEHRFSENWQLRNAFAYTDFRQDRDFVASARLQDDKRTISRGINSQDYTNKFYNVDTYAVGKFATGTIGHQLVTGFTLSRGDYYSINSSAPAPSIDLFDPVYGQKLPRFDALPVNSQDSSKTDTLGIYIQDQISLLENLKFLIGGRFDIIGQTSTDLRTSTTSFQQDEAFTPRLGIVYQPIPPISLYASYIQSFTPVGGSTFDGKLFQPERGTQYEVGVKADVNDRLSATLALFNLTRSNVTTDDTRPGVPPDNFIQVGEQRSRGIELTVVGEILPGWKIITGYAYTDAEITRDNTLTVGNRLNNVPEHSFNVWTSYEFQSGTLQGLGFGLGLFFIGERQGNIANTFTLPSYLRTDAAIFYRRNRFRAAVNFKNLFDVDYFESALSTNRVFLGDPLTVQGTISWEL